MLQGGDFTRHNGTDLQSCQLRSIRSYLEFLWSGTGGMSIYGEKFPGTTLLPHA